MPPFYSPMPFKLVPCFCSIVLFISIAFIKLRCRMPSFTIFFLEVEFATINESVLVSISQFAMSLIHLLYEFIDESRAIVSSILHLDLLIGSKKNYIIPSLTKFQSIATIIPTTLPPLSSAQLPFNKQLFAK